MPVDYSKYPPDWLTKIRPSILKRAGNRCEGSSKYPECRAENGKIHPITGSKVVLTIAHIDKDVTNNDPRNLRALCQRCHFAHDQGDNVARKRYGKDYAGKQQYKLF